MTDAVRTVADRGVTDFAVRGSRFRGVAVPVADVDAAERFHDEMRAANQDATHVVPAYRVPATAGDPEAMLREWASDDGEPSGSAGDPALNVLVRRDLRGVAVAVVRHYGGTNLGVGGLARAYARATGEAVDAAGVVERRPRERFRAVVDYDDSGTVRSVLESAASDGVEFEADYAERVAFAVEAPVGRAADLRDRLRSATGGRVSLVTDE